MSDKFWAYTSDGHWATDPVLMTQTEFEALVSELERTTHGNVSAYKGDPCTHNDNCYHCAEKENSF